MPSPSADKKEKNRLPTEGQVVKLRSRTWLVDTIDKSSSAQGTVLNLSCMDDDAQGQFLKVIWENEINPSIEGVEAWKSIGAKDKVPAFDPVRDFAAYFRTLRWNCVTSTSSDLFQAPFRAGIKLDPYQLEPLAKALKMPRVNLFIADDVGLGKTVEAGLVASELLLRKRVDMVMVACPPGMVYQWRDELESKFGLKFEIFSREYVQKIREERGYSVNPWSVHPLMIVSQRLLINETYTGQLRAFLDGLRPGSMLIFDECHNAAPSSAAKTLAIDSKITKAFRDIAHRFEHRLFLSATPHNGHSNSYSALLELLDPNRFCRGTPIKPANTKDVMVRRLKEDIRVIQGGGFPERLTPRIVLDGLPADAPELILPVLLKEYKSVRSKRDEGLPASKRNRSTILISGLQQRLLSSPKAFARTLRVHRKTMEKVWAGDAKSAELSKAEELALREGITADSPEAGYSQEKLEERDAGALETATLASAGDSSKADIGKERKLLEQMQEIVDKAQFVPDARVMHLLRFIREKMCSGAEVYGEHDAAEGAKWSRKRIIIFTQWDDTLTWLRDFLNDAIRQTDQAGERIATYSGSTGDDKREELKAAFNTDPDQHPLRILLCTDAAREGLNLQAYCDELFHFDLPWNPGRLEQRNGRIDRKMQPAAQVMCNYFYYAQRDVDRVLQVLMKKSKQILEELGSAGHVLQEQLGEISRTAISSDDVDAAIKTIEGVGFTDDQKHALQEETDVLDYKSAARRAEIGESIERMKKLLEASRAAIDLKGTYFQEALSVACEKMDLPGLAPSGKTGDGKETFQLPDISRRLDIDGSWSATLDVLRKPPRDGVRDDKWRRSSPIRPIVFEATDKIDESVTQVHLQHALVQRLLGRFITQGYVHHDLSRACLSQSVDGHARVLLLGRVLLVGEGATRLHEQIVCVCGRISADGSKVEFGKDSGVEALAMLNAAMSADQASLDGRMRERLLQRLQLDVDLLRPKLEAEGSDASKAAEAALKTRAETESKEMKAILLAQKTTVEREMQRRSKVDPNQLLIKFSEIEDRQHKSESKYMEKRLQEIEKDLQTEPQRVRDYYKVSKYHLQPVGLAYLWPKNS